MIFYAESRGFDPYHNLAAEEQLLNFCDRGPVLYLWQNERTVVVGRNQDPYRECDVSLLETEGGHLARRPSGGGAVYHDLGNLNFSFLARRGQYNVPEQVEVVRRGVGLLGVEAAFSGRNDLVVAGRKFSGSAFYEKRDRCCHHGTIMLSVDLAAMTRYLTAPGSKFVSKSPSSVKSRVFNLRDLVPGITAERMKAALRAAFEEIYGGKCESIAVDSLNREALAASEARFRAPAWLWGRRGDLPVARTRRFSWGEVTLRLRIFDGRIAEASVDSDAMESELFQALQERLRGVSYDRRGLVSALELCPAVGRGAAEVKRDLAAWLETWGDNIAGQSL